MIGIYCITNLINGKKYIGQSRNIEKRWKKHRRSINSKNNKTYLHNAFCKYGLDNFSFEVLEECKVEDLNEKEIYWISFYDTYKNGYNLTLGGDHADTKNRIDNDTLDKIIDLLQNSTLSITEIAKKFNIDQPTVSNINNGKVFIKVGVKYPIRNWKKVKDKTNYCSVCGKEIYKTSIMCPKCAANARKIKNNNLPKNKKLKKLFICPICGNEVSQKGRLCKECAAKIRSFDMPSYEELFTSFYELRSKELVAQKYNVSTMLIKKWCKYYGINAQRKKEYIERYEKEFLGKKPKKINHFKKVKQLDPETNEVIKIWNNKTEIAKYYNVSSTCIDNVVKKHNLYKGYYWELIE